MGAEEQTEGGDAEHAVFAKKMEVIVVDNDRIGLHAWNAEFASVKAVGGAAGPDEGLQFPLRNGGTPQIETGLIGSDNGSNTRSHGRALLNPKNTAGGSDEGDENGDVAILAEDGIVAGAQAERAENSKYDETGCGTEVSAAAASQDESDITSKRDISEEHPGQPSSTRPTGETQRENAEHFEQAREMIGIAIKTAGATGHGEARKKGQSDEVLADAELNEAGEHMIKGKGEQDSEESNPPAGIAKRGHSDHVNGQGAEGAEEIGPCKIRRRGSEGAENDVTGENYCEAKTGAIRDWICAKPGERDSGSEGDKAVRRESEEQSFSEKGKLQKDKAEAEQKQWQRAGKTAD
jgi:hypothetical protein